MAITHADAQHNASGAASSLPITFANVNAHDLIVIEVRGNATVSISDTSGNTWTEIQSGFGHSHQAFCCLDAAASASLVVTATAGSSGVIRLYGDRFTGSAAAWTKLGDSALNVTSGTSINAGNTASVTSPDVVWLGADTGADVGPLTAGTSNGVALTLGINDAQDAGDGFVETAYCIPGSTGVQNASITCTTALTAGNSSNAFQAAFAAGAGSVPSQPGIFASQRFTGPRG